MKNNKKLIYLFLGALIFRIVLIISTKAHPDLLNHIDWGERLLDLGPRKFYENIFWGVSNPNQPYSSMYLFLLIKIIKDIIFGFFTFINNHIPLFPSKIMFVLEKDLHSWLLRLPFALADLGIAALIYKVVKRFKPHFSLPAAAVFLFNPIVFYNSSVWGQTDSLINFLALLGIYLICKQKYFFGIFLFFFSFTFKMSLVVYIPIVLLILFHYRHEWRKFILPFLITAAITILLAIPFSIFPNPIRWLWYLYTNRILARQGNMLNGNAFNIWLIFYGIDFSIVDTNKLLGMPYAAWGRIIYLVFNLPIWYLFFKHFSHKTLLYTLFLTAFSTFLFFTNMRERYLYPIFPIFTALIFLYPVNFSLLSYSVITLIHLINLYNLWWYPTLPLLPELLTWDHFLLPKIFSGILIVYFFRYLLEYLRSGQK